MSSQQTGPELNSRAWVEVDLGAFARNLRAVTAAAPGAALVPMLKADAYGLGAAALWPAAVAALPAESLWGFGVAAVAEGEALRRQGWTGEILLPTPMPPGEYARAAAARLTPGLSDVESVRGWATVAAAAGERLPFHVEIDTGMGRAGFPAEGAGAWAAAVAMAAGDLLRWDGCFTHFHSADEADLAATDLQQERFRGALAAIRDHFGGVLTHSANSAATLRRGGYGGGLVRPGIFLYGGSAGPGTAPEPVAAVRARVVRVRQVEPGTTVGYGATYTAPASERWATLAIGYGDGLPRRLATSGGEALLGGRRVPIIGRISMDVTVVRLPEELNGTRPGDVATLVGRDGAQEIGIEEVALRCGTIAYEILTGLGPRLPRVYVGGPVGSKQP